MCVLPVFQTSAPWRNHGTPIESVCVSIIFFHQFILNCSARTYYSMKIEYMVVYHHKISNSIELQERHHGPHLKLRNAPQFTNRKMAVMEKNNPTSSPDQCPCPQHRQWSRYPFCLLSWTAWSVCALSFDLNKEVLHNHNNAWIRFGDKWNSLLLSHLLAFTFSVPKDYCTNYHPLFKLISLKYTDIFSVYCSFVEMKLCNL